LDWDYKTERSIKHRAKFRANRPTELGDYATKKKKKNKLQQNLSPFRKLSLPGGLKRSSNLIRILALEIRIWKKNEFNIPNSMYVCIIIWCYKINISAMQQYDVFISINQFYYFINLFIQ